MLKFSLQTVFLCSSHFIHHPMEIVYGVYFVSLVQHWFIQVFVRVEM